MKAINRILTAALTLGLLQLAPIDLTHAASGGAKKPGSQHAKVEPIQGSDLKRVTLTEPAAKRLGIEQKAVAEEEVNGQKRLVIPYSTLIYDPKGNTWVYTAGDPTPLSYQRHSVKIESIEGDRVILQEGPAAGTPVVTVGVTEIYGAEKGLGQ
ncbi:MAG: hypothetical protein KJ558_01375 [Gammaproteobacteria bacterium]|nr:hypothetical protein [Gammaproteobacteria bacterium]MBU1653487.1 hypothetical protein [Gammaproteobacteria bacterium]MBU1962728.1 hypothetical protein [Gammaproteobacteria bacterium]